MNTRSFGIRGVTALCAIAPSATWAAETATPYVEIGAGINFSESLKFQGSGSLAATTRSQLNFAYRRISKTIRSCSQHVGAFSRRDALPA